MRAMLQIAVLALALTSFGAQAKGGCKKIEKACKSAHQNKKECVAKVLAGETVPGVNVEDADKEACKAKKAK